MTIRHALLVALIASCSVGGALIVPTQAAAFTCPDTSGATTADKAPSLDGLYSGATDATASHRLGELMADLRKSGLKPSLIVDHLVVHTARSSQLTIHSRTSRRRTGFAGSRSR